MTDVSQHSEAEVMAAAKAVAAYEPCMLDDGIDCGAPFDRCRCRNIARAALTAAAQVRAQAHCPVCGEPTDGSTAALGIRKGE